MWNTKMASLIGTFSSLLVAVLGSGAAIALPADIADKTSAASPVIVVGFMGGRVRHDNFAHSGVQMAARFRAEYAADLHAQGTHHGRGVYVELFENRRGSEARAQILRLDTNHDGQLTAEEKRGARIVLYGVSWGASETVTLARELEKDGIPVVLTIQVDSVRKIGEDDTLIPANVAEAANFYQPSGILHGRREIRAADSAHTRILGNFRFEYDASPITCEGYPWYSNLLWKQHIEIECDPKVWRRVEELIRGKLPERAGSGESAIR